MYFNRHIAKCTSIVLIVILMQKVGGGLFLHNWLHEQSKNNSQTTSPAVSQHSLNCSCIDDFNLPFTGAEEPVIEKQTPRTTEFFSVYHSSASVPLILFFSLRAPPAYLS
jgi:hypothetical protein